MENIPKSDQRDDFLEKIDILLDERGQILETLRVENYRFNKDNKVHKILLDLDTGIRKRLDLIMQEIKDDMKQLKTIKQKEQQYLNPYSSVRVMDGKYYDKKK